MRSRHIREIFAAGLGLSLTALVACSSAKKEPYEVLLRDPLYNEAADTGMVVAPAGMTVPIEGGSGSLAFITNEFYTSLLVFSPNVRYVEPAFVVDRVGQQGEEAERQFRDFIQSRARGDELTVSECSRVHPLVSERYLLVMWVDETATTANREGAAVDLSQEVEFTDSLYDVTYRAFQGEMEGEVLDLVAGEVLWRGVARYETGELYADGVPDELRSRRSRAALELARLMSAP